jgi:hypothetical protein
MNADFWRFFEHTYGVAALLIFSIVFEKLIERWVSPNISDDKQGFANNV